MSRGSVANLSDADLLARYCASRSAEDFAAIASRHGPMVLRTCLRLTGNGPDAEDAAQGAFLALSQKPAAAQPHLAGWLYKVARDCAGQILRERARRNRREEVHARMRQAPSQDFGELREELDAALVRLPADLREAVVLRYLEGRAAEEAARVAGCNANTFRWRAMKGLERLRNLLAQREVLFSISGLTAFLASEAAATAATAGMATSLAASVTAGCLEGGRAVLVAKQVVGGLFWTKAKIGGLVVGTAVALAGAAAPIVFSSAPAKPQPVIAANPVQLGVMASLGGRRPFPDDNPWNQEISQEPVDPISEQLIAVIGRDKPLFPDFGGVADPARPGVPYVVVSGSQPRVPVRFGEFGNESDAGPYPIPPDAPVEGNGSNESGRLVVIDRDNWILYELTGARRDGAGWSAAGGAVFDLSSNQLRPRGWTSADPAGLPIFAGLVRYDEVMEQKAIRHALRFSCRKIRHAFVAPARHAAGRNLDPNLPPMGMRVRLKMNVDISGFSPPIQVILQGLKTHGMFLANHGSDWYISGTPDPRWIGIDLKSLRRIKGKDFEVVKMGPVETTGK